MARLLIGKHPQGATGLFISQPGVEVENTNPDNTTALLFSTNWGLALSIIHTGVCNLNEVVTLPNVGFRPLIRWEGQYGSGNTATYNAYPGFGTTTATGNPGENRRYDFTRYGLVYNNDTQFKISKKFPSIDNFTDDTDRVFRFVAFNIPANA